MTFWSYNSFYESLHFSLTDDDDDDNTHNCDDNDNDNNFST